jgi:hypothetical protein
MQQIGTRLLNIFDRVLQQSMPKITHPQNELAAALNAQQRLRLNAAARMLIEWLVAEDKVPPKDQQLKHKLPIRNTPLPTPS